MCYRSPVAREIIVSYQGKPSSFGFSRVSRKQLYATRKRIPLDPAGETCRRAELSDDGSMLIVSGMTGQGYFAADGRWVTNDELVGLDPSGAPLPEQPSTLGTAQELEEVEPEALLDLTADSVYALDPGEVDPALSDALSAGKLLRFDFNMRTDYNMETGILVGNDQGLFAIIGNTMQVPWCELEKPAVELGDDDESDDDELDFEMF